MIYITASIPKGYVQYWHIKLSCTQDSQLYLPNGCVPKINIIAGIPSSCVNKIYITASIPNNSKFYSIPKTVSSIYSSPKLIDVSRSGHQRERSDKSKRFGLYILNTASLYKLAAVISWPPSSQLHRALT